ncbi:alcohol dehydrogenase catalytic domain-containing protein [Nonomuraea glycinis]|uniref:Alcohol dehydrogenase n=1 Tax=Nonomuraea glycinis TaxID=2047744 RepID=A0A918A3U9_9ACTN|nr:alcohol dehydrogenase catalytic domain-containing protein [Nonomuraea glycinis]MCA2180245.1 alcohol dehydrogenase catalytic domain-containing protein [Nonomuraea glycinis]GGP03836.1 alcohol dehydrogenase [Nonomuraea glycinis]
MSMRAFVITGPGQGGVGGVPSPEARPGQVVVDVERAGVCGTDAEFFSGAMSYLHTGQARYPIRIGHEWCGVVSAVGAGVDPVWLGQRVTGDTMLGCGHCDRCAGGRHHLCADRYEIGIRNGWPGALAERLPVPVTALHKLPGTLDPALGALVEPGGNALRAVRAARLSPGRRLLVLGPGTIGLLAAMLAAAQGVEVHLMGRDDPSLAFARTLALGPTWTRETLPGLRFDAIIDASGATALPALAAELVEPGGTVVYIGIAAAPSLLDTRTLVLKDVTATGVLSASGGLADTIDLYASGAVDPRPLIAATVTLEEVARVLAGDRPAAWGHAPKVHVDPRTG